MSNRDRIIAKNKVKLKKKSNNIQIYTISIDNKMKLASNDLSVCIYVQIINEDSFAKKNTIKGVENHCCCRLL